jgi:hypothetical protein
LDDLVGRAEACNFEGRVVAKPHLDEFRVKASNLKWLGSHVGGVNSVAGIAEIIWW